jgi:hypothetical protein
VVGLRGRGLEAVGATVIADEMVVVMAMAAIAGVAGGVEVPVAGMVSIAAAWTEVHWHDAFRGRFRAQYPAQGFRACGNNGGHYVCTL